MTELSGLSGSLVQMGRRWPIALFVAVTAVYGVDPNSPFVYDDHLMVVSDRLPDTWARAAEIVTEPNYPTLPYYRPVTRATFFVQKLIHGAQSATPFHLFNAVLAGLLCVATLLFLSLPTLGMSPRMARWGALVFVLHPVASSSVYPIAARGGLIAALFVILTVYAHLRDGHAWRVATPVLFGLALFAKENAVVLILLIAAADVLGRSPTPPQTLAAWQKRYLPLALLLIAYFVIRARVFAGSPSQYVLGDQPFLIGLTPLYALQAWLTPSVSLIYEPMDWRSWFSWPRWLVLLPGMLGVARIATRGWRRAGGDTHAHNALLFWLAWWLVTLVPTMNLLQQDAPFAERYLLLPSLGLIGLLGVGLTPYDFSRSRWVLAVGAAVIALITAITISRGETFRSDVGFSRQWVKTSPTHFLAHYNLARALELEGSIVEAAEHYQTSLSYNPEWASAHFNLGSIHLKQRRFQEAVPHFERYRELRPRSAEGPYSIGTTLLHLNRPTEAQPHLERAVALDPNSTSAHNNLGALFEGQGDLPRAAHHYRRALAIDPDHASARQNLVRILADIADVDGDR